MAPTERFRLGRKGLLLAVSWSLAVPLAWAARPKDKTSSLDHKEFFRPELALTSKHDRLEQVEGSLANAAAWRQFRASGAQELAPGQSVRAYIDARSGAASNIMGAFPLIPGRGVGNKVTLESLRQRLGVESTSVTSDLVARAVRQWVVAHRGILGIDTRQLGAVRAEAVRDDLWQFSIPQVWRGIPVRDARLAGTIVKGNLVLVGAENWGHVRLAGGARLSAEQALEKGFAHAEGRIPQDEMVGEPQLEIVPTALRKGYGHRLIWSFVFQRPPDDARWEVMVDARSGEVIAFQDKNLYADRSITGGVYPLTNTGVCPDAQRCGTMQLAWPMPFADTGFGVNTDSGGIYDYTSGTATTTLTGPYVDIVDSCGAVSESSATGNINLGGANNQHDCTSGGSSAGNTPASRSAFYEVNRIAEQARGWLPGNAWLNSQLDANVNINNTCNAFWNGVTINFYRSGGGCRNTGEIAAIFDHEWGHGLDDFDAGGVLSNSSEAYADIAAIYRLNASCVGYGFFQTLDDGCGQTADGTGFNANEAQTGAAHCDLDCSGVRDADYLKHSPNTPDTALGFVCGSCISGTGPCGRQVHCAAAPVRQAAWDLVKRDLTAAPFNYDTQTALLVGTKLFYQGSGNVGAWHACTCGSSSSGCGATNGYMQWLAADDDNGNVDDGTPHMTAIFNAYNRHGIACSTPAPTNSGCSGQPNGTAGPTLSGTPGDSQVALSWNAVSGAGSYWVMRTEGHAGAEFGKTRIATVTGLSYTDTAVANGRTYYYNVVAQGSLSAACYSKVSNTVTATPTQAPPTPDFSLSCSPSGLSAQQGSSATSTCTVTSTGGFSAAVALDCSAGLPAGASCSYSPASVTPPANGSANSTLTVSVGATTVPGNYPFQARGTSGATVRTFNMSLNVTTVPVPDFSISASPNSVVVTQGGSGSSTISVASINGFSSAVSLSAAGLPTGVTASFSVNPVTPPAGGSASSTLTFTAAAGAATGTSTITVSGTSGSLTRTASITLRVDPSGGGAQTAVFDAALQAPKCGAVGTSCDTGATLIRSRDSLATPESNQPNTINDSCADGASGTYLVDESIERLRVVSVDGSPFAPGKQARVEATVHVWAAGPTSDRLELFYAPNASSPVWTKIGRTIIPTVGGVQTFNATYTLPAGASQQAVRARFRYLGSDGVCLTGAYDDHDDLAFAVGQEPIVNGGLEVSAAPWLLSGTGTFYTANGNFPHGGTGYMYFGVNNNTAGQTYQQVTIPTTATGNLTFWLNVTSSETTTITQYDRLFVEVRNTSGALLATLATYSNLNKGTAGVYSQKTFNMAAYRGQTVRLQFRVTTDISLTTTFRVDDVSLR